MSGETKTKDFKTVTFDGPNYRDFDDFRQEYNKVEHFDLEMPDIMKKAMRDFMKKCREEW